MGISLLRIMALCSLLGAALDPCGGGGGFSIPPPGIKLPTPDSAVDTMPCDGGGYPCGPYGTAKGYVAADASFSAYLDAGHLCKDNASMTMDLSALRQVSFSDWHQGGASCPDKRRRLLWVNLSAGWCTSCGNEVAKVQEMIDKGKLDKRVALLDVVLETKTKGQPATAAFLQTWIKAYGLTFPAALDTSAAMSKYLGTNDLPAALLLDLQTMTIVYKATGATADEVKLAAHTYLK